MLIDGVGRRGGVETLVTKPPLAPSGTNDPRCASRTAKSSLRSSPTPCLQWERRVGRDSDGDDNDGTGSADLDRTFRTLAPWLQRALASRFGYARPDIDDLVQESFIRLGRYSVADRSRHPRALLLRIARNLTVDAHRKAQTRSVGQHRSIDEGFTAFGMASQPEQYAQLDLKRVVLDLPQPLRDVFLLARFSRMTHAEIANHLGISIKTVEWRLAKGASICLERLSR